MKRVAQTNWKVLPFLIFCFSISVIACSPTDQFTDLDKFPIRITHTYNKKSDGDRKDWYVRNPDVRNCTSSSLHQIQEKMNNWNFYINNVSEEFPEKAYLGIESNNKFNSTELKEIACLHKAIFDPRYQKVRIYISVTKPSPDHQYSGRENYFTIEYSGRDLKTERILKSDNALLPVITWFTSLWPF